MLLELALAYSAIALFAAVHTTGSLRRRPARRGERPDRIEVGFLWCVAVAASLLWVVFFPVFVRGWLRTRVPRAVAAVRLRVAVRRAARAQAAALPVGGEPTPRWLASIPGAGRPPVALLPPAPTAPPAAAPSPSGRVQGRNRAG